jgi:lactose/L-arabinose transport system substrate-binding protein
MYIKKLHAEDNVLYLANDWSDYTDQTIMGDMVAGVMNGNWIIPTIEQVDPPTAENGKSHLMPTLEGDGKEGYASNGGSSLYITANCKKADLAKKFLAYTFGGSTVTYDGALRRTAALSQHASQQASQTFTMKALTYFNNTGYLCHRSLQWAPMYQSSSRAITTMTAVHSTWQQQCRTSSAVRMLQQALQDAEDQLNLDMGN